MKVFIALIAMLSLSSPLMAEELPRVVILATGGTIAGAGDSATNSAYQAAKLPIDDVLNSVPEIHALAEINGEQVAQIGSQAMNNEVWLKLAARVDYYLAATEVDAIVIIHGTDTMEETAYFLSLVVSSAKPIVLVGSMRPSSSLSPDGARNLYNAVAVAASAKSKNHGVMVVMNDAILSAKDVTKANTTQVSTFVARNSGPLGNVELGDVNFYQAPMTANSIFDVSGLKVLPQVDIVYGYANASPVPVNALVEAGAKGIINAGVGNGNFYPEVEEALKAARSKGVVVVRSSRVGSGHVLRNSEVNDDKLDFVVADDLSPQKARILLMLALTKTKNAVQIQQWFYDF
ncbi:MAG: L-asparaginase [Pseudomonadales bacterium]|jgi:L-asparaginase